ncbi:helix-turn-helix domain-containing protein [Clostridium butyricum]
MDCKELLSAVEAVELLKITKNTVYKLVKRGEILFC